MEALLAWHVIVEGAVGNGGFTFWAIHEFEAPYLMCTVSHVSANLGGGIGGLIFSQLRMLSKTFRNFIDKKSATVRPFIPFWCRCGVVRCANGSAGGTVLE